MAEIAIRVSTNFILKAPSSEQPYRLICKFLGDVASDNYSWLTYDDQSLTIPIGDPELHSSLQRDQWYELVVSKEVSCISGLMLTRLVSNFDPKKYASLVEFIETDPNFFHPGNGSIYQHLKK